MVLNIHVFFSTRVKNLTICFPACNITIAYNVGIQLEGMKVSGNGTYILSANGESAIVVHVWDDLTVAGNPLTQAGITCTIGG